MTLRSNKEKPSNTVEDIIRLTNTSPIPEEEGKEEEVITLTSNLQVPTTQADTQEETLQLESSKIEDTSTKQVYTSEDKNVGPTEAQNIEHTNERPVLDSIDGQIEDDGSSPENNDQDPAMQDEQMSKASQDDNYCTNPVMQPFLSRCIRIPNTEVGCLSFTQMFQGCLHEYPPPSQADAYSQIQVMAQRLDMYLNQYLAQYINCMTSDSEFVAFVNHAIQMAFDLTAYPYIWAVLLILLETQDINNLYVQVMHDYYNECYDTKTEEYMIQLEQVAEKSKYNMYNNTLDEVSAHIQQSVHDPQIQQWINMMSMLRIAHTHCIMPVLMTY